MLEPCKKTQEEGEDMVRCDYGESSSSGGATERSQCHHMGLSCQKALSIETACSLMKPM